VISYDMIKTDDMRYYFCNELRQKNFVTDKNGGKLIEMIGACFLADKPSIFGTPNQDYITREIAWYNSQIGNVNAISGKTPEAWKMAANDYGQVNSNYGQLIYSDKYFNQYGRVLDELLQNDEGRRATMVYNRPSIWEEYNEEGKSDFICTNAVTYYIRNDKLFCVVQMRSNDVVFGYKNDYAWQLHVLETLVEDYNQCKNEIIEPITCGDIIWQVQNMHVYERHFDLVK
jgi:thymidylate synthase